MIVGALLPSPSCGRVLALFLCCSDCGLVFFVGGFVLFGLLPVPIFIGEVLSVFFFSFVVGCMGCCPPFAFWGRCCPFFLFPWALGSCILWLWRFCLLEINSYLSKKKNIIGSGFSRNFGTTPNFNEIFVLFYFNF